MIISHGKITPQDVLQMKADEDVEKMRARVREMRGKATKGLF